MIEQWLEALEQFQLLRSDTKRNESEPSVLSDEDVADMLWLSAQMGKNVRTEPSLQAEAEEDAYSEDKTPYSEDEDIYIDDETPYSEIASPPTTPPPSTVPAYPEDTLPEADDEAADDIAKTGLPLEIQTAPALQNTRGIGRALRPLMRTAPSRVADVIDEEATVDRIAEEDIWFPVLKPARERWFDLELVIEAGPLGFVWDDSLAEFQRLLERQGAFRHIRAWQVSTSETETPQLRSMPINAMSKRRIGDATELKSRFETTAALRSPKELIDASKRSPVMYVSDCRSQLWQSGRIHRWLKLWSRHGPVTLVQLLPERLWQQTALKAGFRIQVSAFAPGVANTQLRTFNTPARHQETSSLLTLPAITLTEAALKQWAQVVMASGQQRLPARLFDMAWVEDSERLETADWAAIEPETPADRLELFESTASAPAQRLARLMSVVPVELPVVHIIQQTFFKDTASPVHVAEVYSSCLMSRQQDSDDGEPKYEFETGVRSLLNQQNLIDESLDVLDAVSQEIARSLGFEIKSFTALLLPNIAKSEQARSTILPFAEIATDVLYRLGGQYAELAERVAPVQLVMDEFIVAMVKEKAADDLAEELLAEQPEMRVFEFEVAHVVRSRSSAAHLSSQKANWAIKRETHTGYHFIEALGDEIDLEMVAIPGGTFTMGSPRYEPDRLPYEGPQHQVSLNAFLMSRYPVTQAQWRFVSALEPVSKKLETNPACFKGDSRPVEQVNWYDAVEFCERLSLHTGGDYRLPTESQWEYACRAGTTTPFHFGNTITAELANYDGNYTYSDGPQSRYRRETTAVDKFEISNIFGLCDMHGNVWEWCTDYWHRNYEGAPTDGSAWSTEDEEAYRLIRGGSWYYVPRYCRSAARGYARPNKGGINISFRVCCLSPRSLQLPAGYPRNI